MTCVCDHIRSMIHSSLSMHTLSHNWNSVTLPNQLELVNHKSKQVHASPHRTPPTAPSLITSSSRNWCLPTNLPLCMESLITAHIPSISLWFKMNCYRQYYDCKLDSCAWFRDSPYPYWFLTYTGYTFFFNCVFGFVFNTIRLPPHHKLRCTS